MQRAKNEKLKKQFVDKMLLFLNNKYSRVFKDKGFTNEKLRLEVNKLLGNQNYKTFDYQANLKKVEKSILTKVSKMGDVKYEPVQMSKINELLKFDKEQYSIEKEVNKYLNTINNIKTSTTPASNTISQSSSPLKKYNFALPNIKLVSYRKYKFPKQNLTLEEEKKPNIKKLLPYSNIFKFNKKNIKNKERNNEEKEYKNYPFITEPDYNYVKDPDYHNTLNVVFNSANKEFNLQNDFDIKRKRLENILGINEIPQLNTYDEIAFKKSQTIKNERHKKAEKLSESQKFAVLSRKMQINRVIDQDMNLLDELENKIYKNIIIKNKEK